MSTDLTFHRAGTGPAGRRAGRVPLLPMPAIHSPCQPAIPDEGRSAKIPMPLRLIIFVLMLGPVCSAYSNDKTTELLKASVVQDVSLTEASRKDSIRYIEKAIRSSNPLLKRFSLKCKTEVLHNPSKVTLRLKAIPAYTLLDYLSRSLSCIGIVESNSVIIKPVELLDQHPVKNQLRSPD